MEGWSHSLAVSGGPTGERRAGAEAGPKARVTAVRTETRSKNKLLLYFTDLRCIVWMCVFMCMHTPMLQDTCGGQTTT